MDAFELYRNHLEIFATFFMVATLFFVGSMAVYHRIEWHIIQKQNRLYELQLLRRKKQAERRDRKQLESKTA